MIFDDNDLLMIFKIKKVFEIQGTSEVRRRVSVFIIYIR